MKKLSRKFDGIIYDFIGAHKSKKTATNQKETLKKKGHLVRIVKVEGGYGVYVRVMR